MKAMSFLALVVMLTACNRDNPKVRKLAKAAIVCPPGTIFDGGDGSLYSTCFCRKPGNEKDFPMFALNHGPYRMWYASGEPSLSGHFVDGEQAGIWTWWDKDGGVLKTEDHGRFGVSNVAACCGDRLQHGR